INWTGSVTRRPAAPNARSIPRLATSSSGLAGVVVKESIAIPSSSSRTGRASTCGNISSETCARTPWRSATISACSYSASLPSCSHKSARAQTRAPQDPLEVRDLAPARHPPRPPDLAAVVVVEVADDPEAPVGVRLDEVPQLRRLLSGADEDDRAEVQPARP